MSFGEAVLERLRRRSLHHWFLYADIQAMKAVESAREMKGFLRERGYKTNGEREDVVHFADAIEIRILKRRLVAVLLVLGVLALT